MSLSAEALRQHLDYTNWASLRLMDSAAMLGQEELTRDFQTADHNVIGTLAHIFAADRIWLERIQGHPRATFISDEDRHLPTLQTEWPALHQRWKFWAAPLTDQNVVDELAYRDSQGNPFRQPLWQIILHVVNHASQHRGQISGFLRAMGHTPPKIDMTAYYRTL